MTQSPTPPAVHVLLLSHPPHPPPLPDPAPVARCRCPVTPPLSPAYPRHHRPLFRSAAPPSTSDHAAGTRSSQGCIVGCGSQRRFLTSSRSCGLPGSWAAAASKTLQLCRTLLALPALPLLLLLRLRRKGRRHRLTQVRANLMGNLGLAERRDGRGEAHMGFSQRIYSVLN